MSDDNNNLKPIQYYELLDIKNILENYAKKANSPVLRSCYKKVVENLEKIIRTF